jgi:murein L,D-transpeptidase YcbB/YkuD
LPFFLQALCPVLFLVVAMLVLRRFLLLGFVLLLGVAAPPVRADDPPLPPPTLAETLAAEPSLLDATSVENDEVRAFYQARDFQPAWVDLKTKETAPYQAFLDSLTHLVAYHGLVASDYPLDELDALMVSPAPKDKLKLDILLTASILTLAHDLHGDDLDLAHLYPGWVFGRDEANLIDGLSQAARANDVSAFITKLGPQQAAYAELAKGLAAYRAIEAKGGWSPIPAGPTLRPGDKDPRLLKLRARLAAEGYLDEASDDATFDPALKEALTAYQIRNGLKTDGELGGKTLAALNVPVAERIGQIRANMERWRHMDETFPDRFVLVNIPDMTVALFENGHATYRGPVVVGRPDRKTPFIRSAIRSVIFNPAWHVPAKIARKDILPKLRRDPHYLEKMGLVINGSADDPHGAAIDWNKIRESEFTFRLRQSPGDMNSLGRLKFDFDNDFSVYMHGTPHMETFAKAERAQSSGCVRLRDPEKMAETVLAGNEGGWNADKIKAEIAANQTRWLKLQKPLPIYIVYWTVFQDETSGQLAFRRDIYDYDRFLLEAMDGATPVHKARNVHDKSM